MQMRRKRKGLPLKFDGARRRLLPSSLALTADHRVDEAIGKEAADKDEQPPPTNDYARESDLPSNTIPIANSRDMKSACVTEATVVEQFNFKYPLTLSSLNAVFLTWTAEEESLTLQIHVDDGAPIQSTGQQFSLHGFQALQSLHRYGVVTLTERHIWDNGHMSTASSDIVVDLSFTDKAFTPLENASDVVRRNPFDKALKRLLDELYADFVTKEVKESQSLLPDIDSFYVAIREEQKKQGIVDEAEPNFVPHPALCPALRRYQKKAVKWMLQREMSFCEEKGE
jgi:hypothetical protein